MKQELLKGLSEEQIAKLRECKTQEEKYFDIYSYGNRWNCEECGCWWDENGILEHGKKYKGK